MLSIVNGMRFLYVILLLSWFIGLSSQSGFNNDTSLLECFECRISLSFVAFEPLNIMFLFYEIS